MFLAYNGSLECVRTKNFCYFRAKLGQCGNIIPKITIKGKLFEFSLSLKYLSQNKLPKNYRNVIKL